MSFLRQLGALIWKNFLFTIFRHPVGFVFKFYAIPLVIFSVLVRIPVWVTRIDDFTTEQPAALGSLSHAISGNLAIIRPPNAGADIQQLIDKFTQPIGAGRLLYLDSENELLDKCSTDKYGCHTSVTFLDSPETKAINATWSYIIRSDSGLDGKHTGGLENVYMPLQLAINNAITNSTVVPEAFAFGPPSDGNKQDVYNNALDIITKIYAFIVFGAHLFTVYQITSWVTNDRDSGASALIDSMGGRWASLARTLSWVIVLDVVCMPLFVIFGVLYWKLLFPLSSSSLLIGWQILLGMSLNSAAVFAASFFSKARISAILVCIVFMGLAVASQFQTTRIHPVPAPNTVKALSYLFPPSGYTLFMFDMAEWQKTGLPADISRFPPVEKSFNYTPDLYVITQSAVLAALGVQILVYLGLALLSEWLMHGLNFKGRHFSKQPGTPNTAAVSTTNLRKEFKPGFFARIFCCGRRKSNLAVNDVSLEAHRGQIMCLVGQNGSGKTTTLQMIGGFLSLDAGHVSFDATPSQIGICPQKNVFWEELTVREHVVLWSGIKSGKETREQIDQLIADCDLAHKSNCLAKNLSGGQKRKLQLACMFVGESSICLIDECTSGLDPLSRQAIWDLLLRNRTNRSMIFTTHFLDEVDVLADYIVVLQYGKVKSQGSSAELNSTHGGGYKVIVERTPRSLDVVVPQEATLWQDRLVYKVADSVTATQLTNTFAAAGVHDVVIAGPQFEEVFLNLAGEGDDTEIKAISFTDRNTQMSPGRETSFGTQVGILFGKRFKVLPRVWFPYFFLVAIVVAAAFGIMTSLSKFLPETCDHYVPRLDPAGTYTFFFNDQCAKYDSCSSLDVAPPSANSSLFDIVQKGYQSLNSITPDQFSSFVKLLDNKKAWIDYLNSQDRYYFQAGIYFGNGKEEAPAIGYPYGGGFSDPLGASLLNIWSQANSKIEIDVQYGGLPKIPKDSADGAWIFVLFHCLVQAAYPAFFVVYPAIERRSKTHSLQYANGVRRTPQMVAYMLFDFFWIACLAVITPASLLTYVYWTGSQWVMIPILALYGICGNFISQIVGHVSSGPLKAFLASLAVNLILLAIGLGAYLGSASKDDSVINGITWGLGFFLPIGNVIRAFFVGFNVAGTGCSFGSPKEMAPLDSYGGPILYLVIQVILLGTLSVWVDGGLPFISMLSFSKRRQAKLPPSSSSSATELKTMSRPTDDVQVETARTIHTEADPLRVLNVTKRFGANVAVDDVTFGLSPGEVLALLGPNGAGKSTLVNMIQSEFATTAGQIRLCGHDARSLSARKYLGVCPQHDSLDLLSTRQHLTLYARIKGVRDVRANVDYLMERLDLAPHAGTMAAKLSGGNKRKLSLAIALMGMPPVLALDEPTTAMDAMAKRSFWRIIESIASDHSVLLTTHSMEEADRLASRTAIMAGRMLAIGSTAQLRSKYGGGYSISLTLRSAPNSSQEEMQDVLAFVRQRANGTVTLERDMLRGQIRFTLAPHDDGKNTRQPAAIELWNTLEENKRALGIEFYSIGGATLANAFMNVVRANNVREENSEATKRSFGRVLRDLL